MLYDLTHRMFLESQNPIYGVEEQSRGSRWAWGVLLGGQALSVSCRNPTGLDIRASPHSPFTPATGHT